MKRGPSGHEERVLSRWDKDEMEGTDLGRYTKKMDENRRRGLRRWGRAWEGALGERVELVGRR